MSHRFGCWIETGLQSQPFHQNGFDEKWPSFSPDGRYLAYSSDPSGRFEIYVSPYPGPGGVTQVSAEGGTNPLWSRDGRELFYQNGTKMMAVKVATQPSLSVGCRSGTLSRRFWLRRSWTVWPRVRRHAGWEAVRNACARGAGGSAAADSRRRPFPGRT